MLSAAYARHPSPVVFDQDRLRVYFKQNALRYGIGYYGNNCAYDYAILLHTHALLCSHRGDASGALLPLCGVAPEQLLRAPVK